MAAGEKAAGSQEDKVIDPRYQQRRLAEGLLAAEVEGWTEEWMNQAEEVLEDEELIDLVYEALRQRCPKSRTRGRKGTPAEGVLRLLVLKHVRNWGSETLEREVRANLVYRRFTRIGGEKMPDAKTLGRLGQGLGPKVVRQIHQRPVLDCGSEERQPEIAEEQLKKNPGVRGLFWIRVGRAVATVGDVKRSSRGVMQNLEAQGPFITASRRKPSEQSRPW